MRFATILVTAIFAGFLAGCTSVNVRPISADVQIKQVLIRENPRVEVADLMDVLLEGFERHGITAKIINEHTDPKDAFLVTYTAARKWDLTAYLSSASIWIQQDGKRIAQAEYSHAGGFGFNKWASTRDKLNPVIDQLLSGVNVGR